MMDGARSDRFVFPPIGSLIERVQAGILDEGLCYATLFDGADSDLRREELRMSLARGDRVKILDGPFRDFIGYTQQLEAGRVQVTVSMFGRTTRVTLDEAQVQLVDGDGGPPQEGTPMPSPT
jgi:transcription antitermination factor NusG